VKEHLHKYRRTPGHGSLCELCGEMKAVKTERPIEPKDIVRIKHGRPGNTGVVNRIDGESVNVFVTQNNPSGLGIWFNVSELKRIGRIK
jgi:hypothetical protein